MHPEFATLVESLQASFNRLLAMAPANPLCLPKDVPQAGVYLFSDGRTDLYVGRSNRLRDRIRNHGRETATENQAAFAFRLARHATGNVRPSYRKEGSRASLMLDETFRSAFQTAKQSISAMTVRYVEERDPLRQALLEMYVAVVLQTPHNDFDNH
jgi:hypothetical protein